MAVSIALSHVDYITGVLLQFVSDAYPRATIQAAL